MVVKCKECPYSDDDKPCMPERAGSESKCHVVRIDGGTVTVLVTCTSRAGSESGLYELELASVDSDGVTPKIFVYHRTAAPAYRDGAVDEFLCVADALDLDEIPEDEPDLEHAVPYYRTDRVRLIFRNSDMMYETRDTFAQLFA